MGEQRVRIKGRQLRQSCCKYALPMLDVTGMFASATSSDPNPCKHCSGCRVMTYLSLSCALNNRHLTNKRSQRLKFSTRGPAFVRTGTAAASLTSNYPCQKTRFHRSLLEIYCRSLYPCLHIFVNLYSSFIVFVVKRYVGSHRGHFDRQCLFDMSKGCQLFPKEL